MAHEDEQSNIDDESWRCGGCVDRGPCSPPRPGHLRICALEVSAVGDLLMALDRCRGDIARNVTGRDYAERLRVVERIDVVTAKYRHLLAAPPTPPLTPVDATMEYGDNPLYDLIADAQDYVECNNMRLVDKLRDTDALVEAISAAYGAERKHKQQSPIRVRCELCEGTGAIDWRTIVSADDRTRCSSCEGRGWIWSVPPVLEKPVPNESP